ncbi:MAG: FkbM family methyltransferase [Synergistaceae bacterium]|jgi:FkbM family methyltransferase|nr:FkbM family methyltransferase [Synergistaceae bacterium]
MPDKKLLLYSQDFEDFILFRALEGVENGFYVDVGANSPWRFSVTKLFYDLGWSGINIEPLEDEFQELRKYRPRDVNLNIGAGDHEGEVEFALSGMSTTCDLETINRFEGRAQKKTLRVRRLADILLENAKVNQTIHFCKIDVEGYERNVLEGMDFNLFRPWIFVVEATIPGTGIPCFDKWEGLLLDNRYEFAYSHGINRYYLDSKCASRDTVRNNFKSLSASGGALWEGGMSLYGIVTASQYIELTYNKSTRNEVLFKYRLYSFLSKIFPIDFFRRKKDKYEKRIIIWNSII